jgi:hypothetical protein
MSDLSHTFTVDGFTIKEANGRFFIVHTGTDRYGKPYATLRHACTAIARNVEADYVERKNRRLAFNKKFAVKRRAA